jgi:lipopolysaccharide transport protein LptA
MRQGKTKKRLCVLVAGLLVALPVAALSQVTDLDMRLPMDIDADNTTLDGKNSMIVFNGLRLTQGQISIQADEGRASRMDLEDSYWRFQGNVVIDVGEGRIQCDRAELYFDDFRLKKATVTGSPAIYDLKRAGADEVTHAEAGRLDYNVDAGVIHFSEQATITEGGNQISSNALVYNIAEQRVNAGSSDTEEGRVRITYTPANGIDVPKLDGDEEDGSPPDDEAP